MKEINGVACFLEYRDEILFLKRHTNDDTYPGIWDIPAGSKKPGEDDLEAMVRELKEETGLIIENNRFNRIGVFEIKVRERGLHLILTHYRLTFIEKPYIKLSNEHEECRWVPINKIDCFEETVPGLKNTVKIVYVNH